MCRRNIHCVRELLCTGWRSQQAAVPAVEDTVACKPMPSSCLKHAQPSEPSLSARLANCSHPYRHLKGTRGETLCTPDPAAATQFTCSFHGQGGTSGLQCTVDQYPHLHSRMCSSMHSFIHAFVHPCVHTEVWVGDDTERVKSCQTQLGLQDSRDGFHGPQVLSSPGSPSART